MEGSTAANEQRPDHDPEPHVWVFEVDGVTYRHQRPFITGGEIMDLAGIPRDQGLVLIHEDGSQETVPADERVHLVPGPVFRKRPRFKRG